MGEDLHDPDDNSKRSSRECRFELFKKHDWLNSGSRSQQLGEAGDEAF